MGMKGLGLMLGRSAKEYGKDESDMKIKLDGETMRKRGDS
jgi:hypothetical protein